MNYSSQHETLVLANILIGSIFCFSLLNFHQLLERISFPWVDQDSGPEIEVSAVVLNVVIGLEVSND